jgi:hypothetical protein
MGRGYIAYEFSSPAPDPSHWLHIVRVSRTGGIVRLPPVELPRFPVRGMTCGDLAVDLQGPDARYSVDWSGGGTPAVTSRRDAVPQGALAAPLNLGPLARAGVSDVISDGAPGQFQLVITTLSRRVTRGIERYTTTLLIQRDPAASGARRVMGFETLYAGVAVEAGD